MKAVILAGGEGSRLKEISGGLPKPMMPLLGKPLLERIVELLAQEGFDRICMTLRYRPEIIRSHFGDGSPWGVHMEYRIEQEPLGTAGAVKNCMDFIGGDDFLVISGDCACDFDLRAAAGAHRGGATIVLSEQEEPLPYGLVLTGPGGRITGFLEKPSWERVVTNLVSTGIYVLSPSVMELVPEGQAYDFAKDLFPALLAQNIPLQGCILPGYWCDIGTPRAYYQCNLAALNGLYQLPREPGEAERRCVIPCRSRARLMRVLGEYAAEFGADFSDGLRIASDQGHAHAAPLAEQSAVAIEGEGSCWRHLAQMARQLEARMAKDP